MHSPEKLQEHLPPPWQKEKTERWRARTDWISATLIKPEPII